MITAGCIETPKEPVGSAEQATPPEMLCGVAVDSFEIEKTSVGQGQMISQILTEAGVPYPMAIEAYEKAKPSYDFRRMKAGNTCYIFHTADTTRAVRHFVYEISPTSYIRCTFADSVTATLVRREVELRRRTIAVEIKTSLWNALKDQSIAPQVALDLSDVLAWSVDFFGIEAGDRFGVTYDERYVDGRLIGTGDIWAAVYANHGNKTYAFRHEGDSITGYYDLQGNSTRRAFLKAPLRYSRISSRFSNGRLHPVLKIRRPHHGVDYAAPKGTPVVSIGDGKVIRKGWDCKGGGNFVVIRHNSVYTSEYMHLDCFAKGLTVGKNVTQGEHIGNVGATGLATGPHLDFRMFRDGKAVDPLRVEMPPAEPISNDDIADFLEEADKMKATLDSIFALTATDR